MILPMVIIVILMRYLPMYGVLIAFKNYTVFKGVLGSPWAAEGGFGHFINFFNAPNSLLVLRNTFAIAILKLLTLSLPPVILAVVLNEIKGRLFKKINQTISYIPHFLAWVVVGGMFMTFFGASKDSPLNALLLSLDIVEEPLIILNSTKFFWPILIVTDFWKGVGYGSIIYLGVIATIDPNLYEAVEIDGGGRWAKIKYVTWPFLLETFVLLFILACGSIMSGGGSFDQCYIFGNPMNRSVSNILDVFILRTGLELGRFSYATAVGLFKSVFNLMLLFFANFVAKKVTAKSLF